MKHQLLLVNLEYFSKQNKITKNNFILIAFKYQLLNFKEIKIEEDEMILYKIFEKVDTLKEFSKKYKSLVKVHKGAQNAEDIDKVISKLDLLLINELMDLFKFFYLCKFQNLSFFNWGVYTPQFIDLTVYEIYIWILNVQIKEGTYSSLALSIEKLQKKNNEEDIKTLLIDILNRVYRQIKHGKNRIN